MTPELPDATSFPGTNLREGHAAIVLAAGGSARLGVPKQLLRIGGEPLVHRAVRLAAATAPARLLAVLGANHDPIAESLRDLAHEALFNPDWESGLASSLRTAAPVAAQYGAVLILACDQPALELRHLHALLAGAARAPARCAAALPGTLPGIPAVVPGGWFGRQASGDAGFRPRLRSLPPGAGFMLRAPELLLDIDTPDDLRRACAQGLLDDPDAACSAVSWHVHS